MKNNTMMIRSMLAVAALGAATAFASPLTPNGDRMPDFAASGGIPLANWTVDSKSFARTNGQLKAATDVTTLYRPIAVCRLLDTRGFPGAVAVPGPIGPNTSTNVGSAGNCGIPNNGLVAGLSVSFHVLNLTPNNGGYISFLQQGAPIAGTNAVFAPGQQWVAATANISIVDGSGNFMMYVANSQVHVIVDVNGYYQNMDSIDSNTETDFTGTTPGDLFEVFNAGTGSAISTTSLGGAALTIKGGSVRASGAAVGSNTFASIHQVVAPGTFGAGGTLCSSGFPSYSVFDNPQSNGDEGALLFITARNDFGVSHPAAQYEAYWLGAGGCTSATANNHWMIHRTDNVAIPNGTQVNVMVIKP